MRSNLPALAFGAACAVALPAFGQVLSAPIQLTRGHTTESPPGAATTRLRVDSTLVLIPVIVTDRFNRLVLGLVKNRFRVFEEDREQEILSLSSDDGPASIGIVFDCSGSMVNKLWKSRAAVAEFLGNSNPQDEFFLVEFNNQAHLIQAFTWNTEEIQLDLAAAETRGATALLDAVHLAMRQMRSARHPRKALLIVSDGGDNKSRHTEYEVKNLVREADVQIFAIGIYGPRDPRWPTPEELAGPQLLSDIAGQSGGREYSAKKLDDLPDIAAEIGRTIRSQYVLGYAPRTPPISGKYRKVDVKLNWPDGSERPKIFWKHGYSVPGD